MKIGQMFIHAWWLDHGTKILGFATAAIGMLEYIDSQTIQAVEFVFGPKYGTIISHGLVAVSGFLVAKRGWANTEAKKIAAEKSASPPA